MPTVLFGTPFDDLIFASIHNNQSLTDVTVYAGDGDDTIFGSSGEDTLLAGNGSDVVFSGIGADEIHLESGDDTLRLGEEGGNTANGGTGTDTIVHHFLPSTDILTVEFDFATGEQTINQDVFVWNQLTDFENYIFTGDADTRISGSELNNEIIVGVGDDELNGQGGNDTLNSGIGNDTITGGDGMDLVMGMQGNDLIFGDNGNDTLDGGAGADSLDGGAGIDTVSYATASVGVFVDLTNGSQNTSDATGDTFISIENMIGSDFDDAMRASGQANVINGGNGDDFVLARSGDDSVLGGAGDDRLEGNNGDDTLVGGTGADTLNGGSGYDVASYADGESAVVVDLLRQHRNTGEAERDTLISIEHIVGSDFDDGLVASALSMYLDGGIGNDKLIGNDGDDTLEGGLGADALNGGNGTDTATYADAATATKVDLSDASNNSGEAAGDTYINIENLIGSNFDDEFRGDVRGNVFHLGEGDDFGLGRSGNDVIYGQGGEDRIEGGNGNDTLEGGASADFLNGGNGSDSASYSTATAGLSVDLGNWIRNTGDAAGDTYLSIENLIGSAYTDALRATGGDNKIFAGDGNDFVLGRSGNDLVYGEAGNDRLEGGNGSDTLFGGSGRDELSGGDGTDTFIFAIDGGSDTVTDFADGFDVLMFSGLGASASAILSNASQVFGDVKFDFGGGDTFTLENTLIAEITEADILIA